MNKDISTDLIEKLTTGQYDLKIQKNIFIKPKKASALLW